MTHLEHLQRLRAWFSPASAKGAAFLTLAIEARRQLTPERFRELSDAALADLGLKREDVADAHQLEELCELAVVQGFGFAFTAGLEEITRGLVEGKLPPRLARAEDLEQLQKHADELEKELAAAHEQNRLMGDALKAQSAVEIAVDPR